MKIVVFVDSRAVRLDVISNPGSHKFVESGGVMLLAIRECANPTSGHYAGIIDEHFGDSQNIVRIFHINSEPPEHKAQEEAANNLSFTWGKVITYSKVSGSALIKPLDLCRDALDNRNKLAQLADHVNGTMAIEKGIDLLWLMWVRFIEKDRKRLKDVYNSCRVLWKDLEDMTGRELEGLCVEVLKPKSSEAMLGNYEKVREEIREIRNLYQHAE